MFKKMYASFVDFIKDIQYRFTRKLAGKSIRRRIDHGDYRDINVGLYD